MASSVADIDLDTFKAKRPWKQVGFWVAVAPMILVLLPTDARDFIMAHWRAVAGASGPFMIWLAAQGYVRGKGVEAAGAVAASRPPNVFAYGEPTPNPVPAALEDMHDDAGMPASAGMAD